MDINFKNKSIGFTQKCEWKRTIAPQICVQNRVAPNQLYGLILLEDQSYSWYVSLKQMCDVVFRLAPVRSSAVSKPGSGHSSGGFSDANTCEVPENFRRITVQIFDGFGVDTWKVAEVSGADTYEVFGGRWRWGAKFRKIPAQIRRGIPEGFRADTWWCSGSFRRRCHGLEFRSGIHFYAAYRASDFKMHGLVFTCK